MKFLKSFLLMAFAVLFFAGNAQAQDQTSLEEISPVRAKLMMSNDGALMVDVREKDEVASLAYDVKNIINVPLSELSERMSEIPKDKQLIMACRSGNRSRKAANILLENGFTNLVNMEGGILAWESKGLGVVKDGKPAAKKACCAKPNSADCNPDGTCKPGAKAKKSCCASKSAEAGKACCAKKKSGTK